MTEDALDIVAFTCVWLSGILFGRLWQKMENLEEKTKMKILNIAEPADAKEYIRTFREEWKSKRPHSPIMFCDTLDGRRVWLDDMTDEDAVMVASWMCDLDTEASKRVQRKGMHQ